MTILAMGSPEVSGVSEQREPLLAGAQHRVRLMACCASLLVLQWQGSAWGNAGHSSEALRWQRADSGHVVGSRHLLWEQGALGGFWTDGQLPQWARCNIIPPLCCIHRTSCANQGILWSWQAAWQLYVVDHQRCEIRVLSCACIR